MVHLENDTFLLELTRMFQKSRSTGTGTLCVTMKKCHVREKATSKGKGTGKPAQTLPQADAEAGVYCLMRAKLHNRKITTSVLSKDVSRFQSAYCNLLKGNMDTLKKVKKTKSKTKKTN